jgi:hypothetical protein
LAWLDGKTESVGLLDGNERNVNEVAYAYAGCINIHGGDEEWAVTMVGMIWSFALPKL